ncbi:hypothetical protein, partial [Peribacillus sp. CSMR9]|uniref:hypothetical protein n=1 Tax=Peribacillus sp. CSMR9 TaxID=2981350 RepID=UPI0029544C68
VKESAALSDIGTYGDGKWTRVAIETVTLDTAGKSKTHSLNGDGVKVCFRTLEGSVKGGCGNGMMLALMITIMDSIQRILDLILVVLLLFIQVLVEMLATKNYI